LTRTWTVFLNLIILIVLGACRPQVSPESVATGSLPSLAAPTTVVPDATFTASPSPSPTSSPTFQQTSTATTVRAVPTTELVATLEHPSPTLSPTSLSCWQQGGTIERAQIESDRLPKPLEFRVYTPPCYGQQPQRRYPVLYLIHGQSFDDGQWDRMGADEVADALIAGEQISPLIIVMPRDRVWSSPEVDKFGEAVVHDLIPWMDQAYRTVPERAHRAIGGLSRGASWAVHLGILNWDTFSAVGAHSLPVFPSDTNNIRKWLQAIPEESVPRFFIDIAELDRWSVTATWFENILTEMDIPHVWHLYTGYHNEEYWQSHMEEYLRWYTQDW